MRRRPFFLESFDMTFAVLVGVIDNPDFLGSPFRVVHFRFRTDMMIPCSGNCW